NGRGRCMSTPGGDAPAALVLMGQRCGRARRCERDRSPAPADAGRCFRHAAGFGPDRRGAAAGAYLRPMPHILAPSLLSADFAELRKAVELIERGPAGWHHIDVMDGVFVPNISFGLPVI